jgi:hypothetical protein
MAMVAPPLEAQDRDAAGGRVSGSRKTPAQLIQERLRSSYMSWGVRPTEMLFAPRCLITNMNIIQPGG